jgi:hypothetical protein
MWEGMNRLHLSLALALAGALLAVGLYFRQNRGDQARMGGRIAPAKAFWLYYTLAVWFVLLPGLLLQLTLPPAIFLAWSALTVSMWIRGLVEAYLLFVTKNWRPPLGIAHDLLTFGLFCTALWARADSWNESTFWTQVFTLSLGVSLLAEVYYATAFYRLVRERTTGEDGVWFASAEDPKFRRIVNVTALVNIPLYAVLFFYLAEELGR